MPNATDKAEQTTEELRELIREAHGLLKDIRSEKKGIERLKAEGIAAWNRVSSEWNDAVDRLAFKMQSDAMPKLMEKVELAIDLFWNQFAPTMTTYVRQCVERLFTEFIETVSGEMERENVLKLMERMSDIQPPTLHVHVGARFTDMRSVK